MKKTRLLALILALLMVVTLFAACGDVEPEETTTEATTTEATTEATTTGAAKLNLGGRQVVVTDNAANTMQVFPREDDEQFQNEYWDGFRQLWADLEAEYNFEAVQAPGKDIEAVTTAVTSGDVDSLGDIFITKVDSWVPYAVNGWIAPLDGEEAIANGLNVNDPKAFDQTFTQTMKLYGNIYSAQWIGKYNAATFGWCMFYNIDYVSEYAGENNLFQVVRDMDWTWEKFMDIQEKACYDADGDGTWDIWGCGEHAYGTEVYTIDGGTLVYFDEADGKYKSGLALPETMEALEFSQKQYNSGFNDTTRGYGDIHRAFKAGEVSMVWGEKWLTSANDMLMNVDFEFGLIPIPKHEDAKGYANVLGGVPGATLFKGNKNFKENCAVLQMFGESFSNENWYETYVNEELGGSEDSLDMVLNYILGEHGTAKLDLGWAHSDLGLNYFRNEVFFPIVGNKGTVAQIVAEQDAIFQSNMDQVYKQ